MLYKIYSVDVQHLFNPPILLKTRSHHMSKLNLPTIIQNPASLTFSSISENSQWYNVSRIRHLASGGWSTRKNTTLFVSTSHLENRMVSVPRSMLFVGPKFLQVLIGCQVPRDAWHIAVLVCDPRTKRESFGEQECCRYIFI